MIKIIYQRSIKELGQLIGSQQDPVPAGGTTTALNGLFGVSLLKLAFQVSDIELTEQQKADFTDQFSRAEELFLMAMDEDSKAFETNLKNNFEDRKQLKEIIEVPVKIAKKSASLLDLANSLEDDIKETVYPDYQIGRENLKTSIRGVITIVESNYSFFAKDDDFLKNIKNSVVELKNYL